MIEGKEPLVGIIIVNFNGITDTIECIDSIKEMSYENYRIIVVDNNSSDDSVEQLRKKQLETDFELIECEDNLGFSAGNNVGMRHAIHIGVEYVLLLNNDTITEVSFLKSLMEKTKELPENSVTTGTIYYANSKKVIWYSGGNFDYKTAKVSHYGFGSEAWTIPTDPVETTFISGCCVCIPVSVIKKVGYLDEVYFLYEEDVDYCYRMMQHDIKLFYIPDAVIYHKVSSSTSKERKMSGVTQYYMVRNKYFFIKKYYSGIRKIKPYCYVFAMYVYYCARYGMNIRYVAMGIQDFLSGKMKKTDRKI